MVDGKMPFSLFRSIAIALAPYLYLYIYLTFTFTFPTFATLTLDSLT